MESDFQANVSCNINNKYSIAPNELIKSIWTNRNMIYLLAKRNIVLRYRGSMIGILWSILLPLFMLSIYSFVYGVILKVKWMGSETQSQFALIIFAGMLMYNFFAECISGSTSIILSNVNYVKKIVFPLEIFPCIVLVSALFQLLVSLFVWLIFYCCINGVPNLSILYFPILFVPFMLLILGAAWFLSALGVYLRDISQVITIILSTLMLITPVFFPISAIPESFRYLFYLNPLTYLFEQIRGVLIFGQSIEWGTILMLTIAYGFVAWLGFVWFQKTRKGFADVL